MKHAWLILLMLPTVWAASITDSTTQIIMDDTLARIKTNFTVYNEEPIGNLTLVLAENAQGLLVEIDQKNKTCLVQSTFARCGSLTKGNHTVTYSYSSSYPIATVGENTLFKHSVELPYATEQQEIELQLPIGYVIPREQGKNDEFYISPEPKEVSSDGQHIILFWEGDAQEFSISVLTRELGGVSYLTGFLALALLLVIALLVALKYVLTKQKNSTKTKPKKQPQQVIIPGLMESEQTIVDLLKKNNEMWQKNLLKETGFSKAKLSRTIRNLEERGVVTRTIYGNANKVSLKKK